MMDNLQEYLNTNISKVIIDYLKPLPNLPFISELLTKTEEIYIDTLSWRCYNTYVIKFDFEEDESNGNYYVYTIGDKINRSYRIWRFDGDNWGLIVK